MRLSQPLEKLPQLPKPSCIRKCGCIQWQRTSQLKQSRTLKVGRPTSLCSKPDSSMEQIEEHFAISSLTCAATSGLAFTLAATSSGSGLKMKLPTWRPRTVIRFAVSVPVLSVQMVVADPIVSQVASCLTRLFFFDRVMDVSSKLKFTASGNLRAGRHSKHYGGGHFGSRMKIPNCPEIATFAKSSRS